MINEITDRYDNVVRAGDYITFSFGIPPLKVKGNVVVKDNELVVLTPSVTPAECYLKDLESYVGDFISYSRRS